MASTNLGTYFFDALSKAIRQGVMPKKSKESTEWFRNQAQSVAKMNRTDFIKTGAKKHTPSNIEIGNMYLFNYDPKHKKTLPVYDTFPLIFPFSIQKDRFYGINLHYLAPADRAKLMDALGSIANNDRYDETTKLGLSWQVLKQVAKGKKYEETVHCYLRKHVKSSMKYITPLSWEYTMMLPLARFKGPRAAEFRGH
jgi:hypothetical protein